MISRIGHDEKRQSVLAIHGLHRVPVVRLCYRHRQNVPRPAGELESLPRVMVPLPISGEVYVVERVIDAAAALRRETVAPEPAISS